MRLIWLGCCWRLKDESLRCCSDEVSARALLDEASEGAAERRRRDSRALMRDAISDAIGQAQAFDWSRVSASRVVISWVAERRIAQERAALRPDGRGTCSVWCRGCVEVPSRSKRPEADTPIRPSNIHAWSTVSSRLQSTITCLRALLCHNYQTEVNWSLAVLVLFLCERVPLASLLHICICKTCRGWQNIMPCRIGRGEILSLLPAWSCISTAPPWKRQATRALDM